MRELARSQINADFNHPLANYHEDIRVLKNIDYSLYARFKLIFFVYCENDDERVIKLK